MTEHKYEVYTRQGVTPFSKTGISRQFTTFSYTKRYQANGGFTLSLPDEAPELGRMLPGNIIEITRDGITDFFGFVTGVKRRYDEKYPASAVAQIKGLDLTAWVLRKRVALPPIVSQQVQYYGNAGAAEAVMYQALTDHFINPSDSSRIIPSLTNALANSPLLGANVVLNLRGEKWDAAMANIALAGNVGYRVWLPTDSGGLQFQVYTGVNHSAHQTTQDAVVFNPAYRDLRQFDYDIDLEQLENHLYSMGGNSSTANRFFVEDENLASIAAWGRWEALTDAQNAYTTAIAHSEAQVYLAPKVAVERISFSPKETSQSQYLTNWALGDTVTVTYPDWNVDLDVPVVEVKITLTRQAGEMIETSTSLLTPDVIRQLRRMVQAVQPAMFAPSSVTMPRYAGNANVPTVPPAVTGSTYFDTNTNTAKVWDGSAWRVLTWT